VTVGIAQCVLANPSTAAEHHQRHPLQWTTALHQPRQLSGLIDRFRWVHRGRSAPSTETVPDGRLKQAGLAPTFELGVADLNLAMGERGDHSLVGSADGLRTRHKTILEPRVARIKLATGGCNYPPHDDEMRVEPSDGSPLRGGF
jgi:hypothetical protein